MKTNDRSFALRVSVAATRTALLALALAPLAYADDSEPTVKQLTTPTNSIDFGGTWVSRDNYKFGEYNGLYGKGLYGNFDADLRGGGSYDSNDASRWHVLARDLGTDERSAKAEYGMQGLFRLNIGYDSLFHAIDDRYHTPLVGVGTNNLTFPGNWTTPMYRTGTAITGTPSSFFNGVVTSGANTVNGSFLGLGATSYNSPLVAGSAYVCPTAGTAGCAANPNLHNVSTIGFQQTALNTAILNNNAADLADFNQVNLHTQRQKFDLGALYDIDPGTNVAFSYRQERKNGMQELGVVNAATGPSASGSTPGSLAGENSTIIPKLIDTVTDQYNLSYNAANKKGFFTAAYYGSIFTNKIKSMTVADPWGGAVSLPGAATLPGAFGPSSATISEEPDNQLHQFRLTGGYDVWRSTKLVGDASYSRNTQNDSFILDPSIFQTPTSVASGTPAVNNGTYVPEGSANAVVVEKTFDLKLTSRPLNRVNLTAAYKYDNRDNQTPVNTFAYYDAGDAKNSGTGNNSIFGTTNGLGSNATIPGLPVGTPLYNNMNVVDNRPYSKTINDGDLEADIHLAPGHALRVGYDMTRTERYCHGTWIDCSFADTTRDNTEKVEYRFTALETVTGRLAYDHTLRSVDYNPNAWMSLNPALNATNVPTLAAQGWTGSVLGFMNTYGLTANGLAIPSNVTPTLTPVGSSPLTSAQALNIYNLLYGNGNGSLNNSYYLNHNVTDNWAGLDVYNMSNRDRNRVRGQLNWQAVEAIGLQAGFDYRHDHYPSNLFGLQSAQAWSANFDAAFTPNEVMSLDVYYTHEDQKTQAAGNTAGNGTVARTAATGTGTGSANNTVAGGCIATDSSAGLTNPTQYQIYNNNSKIDPCDVWGSNIHDRADTVGLGFTDKKLISRKVSLSVDASFTRDVTGNSMSGGSYSANALTSYLTGVPAVYFINAASLPDVVTTISHVGFTGRYVLTKQSAVRLAYSINWYHTDDYMYSTTQPGAGVGQVIPTLETPMNYVVHVVGISYSYMFQ